MTSAHNLTPEQALSSVFQMEEWPALAQYQESTDEDSLQRFCVSTLLDPSLELKQSPGKRQARISDLLEFPAERPLLIPNQKHTRAMVEVHAQTRDGQWQTADGEDCMSVEADGIWTTRDDVTIAVRTADCVPILLFSRKSPFIAAVHSGWRGTKSRILDTAIDCAKSAGVPPEDLEIWIGPRISGDVYEVSEELAEDFAREFPSFSGFRKGRLIDLGSIITQIALEAGVPKFQIFKSKLCTYLNPDLFPSYRRDGKCRGEIISAITQTRNASI